MCGALPGMAEVLRMQWSPGAPEREEFDSEQRRIMVAHGPPS